MHEIDHLGWMEALSSWSVVRTGLQTFTVGESAQTNEIFRQGRALRVLRDGDSDFTPGFIVTNFASGGASGRATVTVDGLTLGAGAIRVQWLEEGLIPVVHAAGGALPAAANYAPGWFAILDTAPIALFGLVDIGGAHQWGAIAPAITGVVNPDTVVPGIFGQLYLDTNTGTWYRCDSNPTGTSWAPA